MADESKLKPQAREWLEANTGLRWCTEPQEGDPVDEPIENLNRRPQQWADRLAAFADLQVKAETADPRSRLTKLEAAVKAIDAYWESGNFSRDPGLWQMLKDALKENK